MALRVNRAWAVVGLLVGASLLVAVVLALISGLFGLQRSSSVDGGVATVSVAPQVGAPEELSSGAGGSDSARVTDPYESSKKYGGAVAQGEGSAGAPTPPMIIRSAALEVQVDKVDEALDKIRAAASKNGADVEQLTVTGGRPSPQPLTGADSGYPTPASATVVLRVPAEKLGALSADLSKLGTVISQSASSDDVSQQYVDLEARLKNLKTEEARLRTFFARAGKVDDLLAIERELSRVRGEIEAMQAQVDYLERQVARATLTVNLTEPRPVIQPGGADWGFTQAIRRGVQGAAALITALITVLIAIAPLAVVVALVWFVVRKLMKRRHSDAAAARDESATPDDA